MIPSGFVVCVGLGAPVIVGKRVNRGDADR